MEYRKVLSDLEIIDNQLIIPCSKLQYSISFFLSSFSVAISWSLVIIVYLLLQRKCNIDSLIAILM